MSADSFGKPLSLWFKLLQYPTQDENHSIKTIRTCSGISFSRLDIQYIRRKKYYCELESEDKKKTVMIKIVETVGNNQPLELFMPQKTAAGLTEYKGLEIMKHQLELCSRFHFIFWCPVVSQVWFTDWPLVMITPVLLLHKQNGTWCVHYISFYSCW